MLQHLCQRTTLYKEDRRFKPLPKQPRFHRYFRTRAEPKPEGSFGRRIAPSEDAYYEEKSPLLTEDQFEKGLIPRAKELLTLGGTFTLSFLPSIIVVASIAAALYFVFGASLVHFGNEEMTPPTYVNPYELLGYPYTD